MKSESHIAAEHFPLTDAIRLRAVEQVERVEELAPVGTQVRLFLSHDAGHSFSALFRVHIAGRDLVAREECEDLYLALTRAGNRIRKRILREFLKRRNVARASHRKRETIHESADDFDATG
ncbi:MAG: HPF/RaiA family ribosome-associated protein [Bdellovibrionota bacterium]